MACLGSDHIEPFRNLSQVGSGGLCIDKMTNCDPRLIVPNTGAGNIDISVISMSVRFIINPTNSLQGGR